MIKKVLIIVKKDASKALEIGENIAGYLTQRGVECLCDSCTATKTKISGIDPSKADVDLMIVLGGDGTLLWAESQVSGKDLPILGINFGTMGFLTELGPENWQNAMDRILQGEYKIDKRNKIDVLINGQIIGKALNEVVVKTAMPVEMLNLEVSLDGQEVETMMADGVIVATPTGSTAYSMSVGGPIVDTRVGAFIITAISPFKLGSRPFVVPETSQIEIFEAGGKKSYVVIDGEIRHEANSNDRVVCKLSKDKAHIVKLDSDFYDKIQKRLRR